MIDVDRIRAAAQRIRGVAHVTPLLEANHLSVATGAQVWLKQRHLRNPCAPAL